MPLIERLAFTGLEYAFELDPASVARYRVC